MNKSNYKTWMCKHYLNGYCKFSSDECNFAHGRKEIQKKLSFEFLEKTDSHTTEQVRKKLSGVRAPSLSNS